MSTDSRDDAKSEAAQAASQEAVLELLDSFRDHWSRGERISVEDFVKNHEDTAVADEEVLLDVVFAEYVAREELGEHPTLDEYVRRFPKLTERLTRLLSLDEAIREMPPMDPAAADTDNPHAVETISSPLRNTDRGEEPPPVAQETSQRIGKYLIVGELGSGGQGKVYRAVHPSLAREVVIKLSHVHPDIPSHLRDELAREGRLLAELDHPHLARVHDFDFHEGEPFLVMEYVPGANLEQYSRQSKLTPERIASLTAKIARAVAAVHKKGIVHRDLKPRNIMVCVDGEPRLIDFGLALADTPWRTPDGRTDQVVGTLAYMSPEQGSGDSERIGPAADVYALGGILYFLLTGRAPFKGKGFDDTLAKVVANDYDAAALDRATAPESLKRICRKLLAKEPTDRYPSADAAADALEREGAGTTSPRWIPVATAAALAATVLVAVSVITTVAILNRGTSPQVVTPALTTRPTPEVTVDIWNPKTQLFREMQDFLRNGDRYKVRVKVPAGVHVSLFQVTNGTKIEHAVDVPPADDETTIDFPKGANKSLVAKGPGTTEMFLAIARKKGPVTAAEIGDLFAGPNWPTLTNGSRLNLRPNEVTRVGHRGEFTIVDIAGGPEEIVKELLESLRPTMRERFDGFDGFVFGHEE